MKPRTDHPKERSMRNRKFSALIALFLAFTAITAGAASAHHDGGTLTGDATGGDAEITAVLTSAEIAGTRSITSVAGGVDLAGTSFTDGTIALLATADATVLSSPVQVTVTEELAPGVNNWHVTFQATDLTYDAEPDGIPEGTISNANLELSNRQIVAPTDLASTLSETAPAGAAAVSDEVELFTVGGQTSGSLYTGLYTSTADIALNLPASFTAGNYSSSATVTLYD